MLSSHIMQGNDKKFDLCLWLVVALLDLFRIMALSFKKKKQSPKRE